MDSALDEYRQNPPLFFELPITMQTELLREVCGELDQVIFQRQDPTKCLFERSIRQLEGSPVHNYSRKREVLLSHLNVARDTLAWNYLAALMIFFRVEQLGSLTRIGSREAFASFRKVFSFGCFGFQHGAMSNAEQWVYGRPSCYLIPNILSPQNGFSEQELELVFNAFSIQQYNTLELQNLCKIAPNPPLCADLVTRVFNIVSQKRYIPSLGKSSIYPFASLLQEVETPQTYYLRYFKLPKPRWTRQNHRELTCPRLNKEFKTVILMQKFRPAEFPLHRDLVTTVCKHLFDAYYDELREVVVQIHAKELALLKLSPEELADYALDYGIVTSQHARNSVALDLAYLSFNIPLEKHVSDVYIAFLENALIEKSNLNGAEISHSSLVAERIVDYCNTVLNFNYRAVLNGSIKLIVENHKDNYHISHVVMNETI